MRKTSNEDTYKVPKGIEMTKTDEQDKQQPKECRPKLSFKGRKEGSSVSIRRKEGNMYKQVHWSIDGD